MSVEYTVEDVDTHISAAVAEAVCNLHNRIFSGVDTSYIHEVFEEVEQMFLGHYQDYQAIDTSYHDLEHTLQATLCFIRLITLRQLRGTEPLISANHFRIGLHAILLHDVGYLKKANDDEGTGAKFTFIHERRSCELAGEYLKDKGWNDQDIETVKHLISCTGPRSEIDNIPFIGEIEQMLGKAVCTADYLGQMSDPNYVSKLPVLYDEFEESDDYRGVPREKRIFKSVEDLLNATPFFWEKIVLPKLETDCAGLYRHLQTGKSSRSNPYICKIEENIQVIRALSSEILEKLKAV